MKLLCCFFLILLLCSCGNKKIASVDNNEETDEIHTIGVFIKSFTNLDENVECVDYSMSKEELDNFVINYKDSYMLLDLENNNELLSQGGTLINEDNMQVMNVDIETSEEIYYTFIILSYNKTQDWYILEEDVSTKYTFEGIRTLEIAYENKSLMLKINAHDPIAKKVEETGEIIYE